MDLCIWDIYTILYPSFYIVLSIPYGIPLPSPYLYLLRSRSQLYNPHNIHSKFSLRTYHVIKNSKTLDNPQYCEILNVGVAASIIFYEQAYQIKTFFHTFCCIWLPIPYNVYRIDRSDN